VAEVIGPTGNTYGFAGTNGKYYTDYNAFAEEQLVAKDLAIEEATEGFVMLKNENNVLPLKKNAKVSLFGMHAVSLVASTVGSAGGRTGANGIEESTLTMAMEHAGFRVNTKLTDLYTKHQALGTTGNELPVSYYTPAVISTYNGYHDAAIVVFSRTGSEGSDKGVSNIADHSDPKDHQLMLDDNEKALIKHIKEYYTDTPIIVLVNAATVESYEAKVEDGKAAIASLPHGEYVVHVEEGAYMEYQQNITVDGDGSLDKIYHQTVKKVTEDFESLGFNTAIS
jgi:hypothetical protein